MTQEAAEPVVRVLLFGPVAEALGARELEVPVAGESVEQLMDRLVASYPALAEWRGRCALAVNGAYAGPGAVVREGDEVAILPPVSGGQGGGAGAFRVVSGPLDPGAVLERVRRPEAGATVVFVGTVRGRTAGRRTLELEYDAYAAMAEAEMARIAAEAAARWPEVRLAIDHRVGRLEVGEVSVVIAASAPHRAEAFAACRYALEELKRRVPIWKKERYEGGEVWVGRDGTHPFAVPARQVPEGAAADGRPQRA